jgi:hypothetical protein
MTDQVEANANSSISVIKLVSFLERKYTAGLQNDTHKVSYVNRFVGLEVFIRLNQGVMGQQITSHNRENKGSAFATGSKEPPPSAGSEGGSPAAYRTCAISPRSFDSPGGPGHVPGNRFHFPREKNHLVMDPVPVTTVPGEKLHCLCRSQ